MAKLKHWRQGKKTCLKPRKQQKEIVKKSWSVQQWIQSVDRVKKEARNLMEDNANSNKRCFRGWFPNVRTLYRLSREAESKHETIERLCEEQPEFDHKFARPPSPPGIDSIPSEDFVPFQTTKLAMEKVMDALKEESTNFVGIHGMGGVGKTTLVKQIGRKCEEERLFDKVVMAVVSQTLNIERLQNKIADFLGPEPEEQNEFVRASRLCARLKRHNKILVILDDVWAKLPLAEIGIPLGEDHKGCKVVITTRRKQVCTAMCRSLQATRIVGLDVLTEQESWDLFKLQVGDIIESSTMRAVAEKVVKECGCLPIALVTVGSAMRGKEIQEWEGAALELEKSNPANIEDMDEKVFKCIKFSYDYLRDEEAKACFRLCCLFPEDYNIETETLVKYGVGLSTFKGINKIQEARSRAHFIINNLKAASLLLASEVEERWFKMHDVVRDVAKRIASDRYFVKAGERLKEWPNELCIDGYIGIGGISLMSNDIRKYPEALECPDLEIFLMQDNPVEQEMPEEVFRGMKKLRVLDQSQDSRDRRLEPSFSHLTNLRTLVIDSGHRSIWGTSIWGISALGELKMLQVLSLRRCRFEDPLDALRRMKNLRLLDLRGCKNCSSLFNFGEDFNFPKLEELYLTEGMSCGVAELMKCCPRLNVLTFRFNDIIQIPHNFDFSHLDGFDIYVAADDVDVSYDLKNSLCLGGKYGVFDDVALPDWTVTLLARLSIMCLYIWRGLRNINPYLVVSKDGLAVLKRLQVVGCDELEYLFDLKEEVKDVVVEEKGILANLTDLHLRSLSNLEELWKGHIELVHLRNLKTVYIDSCPKLKVVFHWSVAQRLEQLQYLNVQYCDELEEIVGRETGEEVVRKGSTNLVPFRNLHTVDIESCPKLKVVFHWSVAQRLDQLHELNVIGCRELEEIVGSETGEEVVRKGSTNLGNLVPVRNLKAVYIQDCPKLKVAFLWSVAQRLEQLQHLIVSKCDKLEEIVGREMGEEAIHNKVVFPRLQDLYMISLPKLNGFYTGNMPGSQSTPKLRMGVDCYHMDEIPLEGRDLDRVIKENKGLLVPVEEGETVELEETEEETQGEEEE